MCRQASIPASCPHILRCPYLTPCFFLFVYLSSKFSQSPFSVYHLFYLLPLHTVIYHPFLPDPSFFPLTGLFVLSMMYNILTGVDFFGHSICTDMWLIAETFAANCPALPLLPLSVAVHAFWSITSFFHAKHFFSPSLCCHLMFLFKDPLNKNKDRKEILFGNSMFTGVKGG